MKKLNIDCLVVCDPELGDRITFTRENLDSIIRQLDRDDCCESLMEKTFIGMRDMIDAKPTRAKG